MPVLLWGEKKHLSAFLKKKKKIPPWFFSYFFLLTEYFGHWEIVQLKQTQQHGAPLVFAICRVLHLCMNKALRHRTSVKQWPEHRSALPSLNRGCTLYCKWGFSKLDLSLFANCDGCFRLWQCGEAVAPKTTYQPDKYIHIYIYKHIYICIYIYVFIKSSVICRPEGNNLQPQTTLQRC